MQRELQSEIPRAGEQARHGGVRGDERLFGVHGRARAHRLRRQESTQHSRPGILRPPGASAHTDRHHRHQGQDHHRVLHARHHQRAEWKHDGIVLVGGQLRGRHALRGIRPHDARIARRGAHDARGGEQRHEIPGDGGLLTGIQSQPRLRFPFRRRRVPQHLPRSHQPHRAPQFRELPVVQAADHTQCRHARARRAQRPRATAARGCRTEPRTRLHVRIGRFAGAVRHRGRHLRTDQYGAHGIRLLRGRRASRQPHARNGGRLQLCERGRRSGNRA